MASARPTRTNAHDDGVDRWAMVRAAPAPALAGHVRSYCPYWEETGSFAARRELAGTTGVLIYALGEPLEIVGADGRAIVLKAGEGFSGGIADGTSISRGLGAQAERLADESGLAPGVKARAIIAWLKKDYDLGHGHAMSIVAYLKGKRD